MIEKSQQLRIRIIFLAAIIFLIALSIFSYVRINNLIEGSAWINHTHLVKFSLQKITTAVFDAETNQKNYLLTGNPSVLLSRDAAFNRLNTELNLVDSLIKDNPVQIENFKILQSTINLKLLSMKKVLMLYTSKVKTPEFTWNITEGIRLTANIQQRINSMQIEEDRLLKVRAESFSKSAFVTPFSTILLILGSIIILIAAYFKIISLNQSLETSKERYHLMVEEVEDYAILYLNREGIIENWNAGAEKIKGYKVHEITGKHFSQFYTEEDRKNNLPQKLLAKAVETGKAVQEGWRVRKDGSLFWASVVITAIHNEKKDVIGFSKVTHDLTVKKAAEDIVKKNTLQLEQKNIELENKTSQLEEAQQLAHIGSWEWDVPANKIEWSDELYRIYGLTPQEFKADYENFLKYIHPDDREYVNGIVQQAFRDQQPFNFIHKVICPDGTERVVSSTGKVFSDSNGNTIRMAGTAQDISEREKARELLTKQNENLLRANKELESFNYISSHDLQEPLRQIQNFASRIITDEQQNLSDKGKNYFSKINNAANRMQNLIADLLSYSRTSSSERKFETTDLNEIIEEVKEDLKEDINTKHATIEATELCDVNIIPFQFRQLMHNLIGNSLKFSNPETPPHIKIKSKIVEGIKLHNEKLLPQKKYCHISVSDNGIGFELQYKDRIFEVFQRLHDKQKITGTGIGLAIVKKIVENHNGVITATGEVNKGATFDIYIPAI